MEESKNFSKEPNETKQPLLKKRNSLIETNETAKWFHDVLMKKMDKHEFTRSMLLFTFQAFFLGNNQGIYLWLFIFTSIYLYVYRIIRFWVKRQILYLFEFCYFGNYILLLFLLIFNQSIDTFKITYICNTGVMTFAVVALNNQAQFNSNDHFTSSYIHIMPLITVWTIRWRENIYGNLDLSNYYFNFFKFENNAFSFDNNFYQLIYLSLLYWLFWAMFYFIMSNYVFSKYFDNHKYGSAIKDFINTSPSWYKYIFGDLKKGSKWKYLIQHFIFMITTMPFALICYYSYTFNTTYVTLFVIYLIWNTGRNNLNQMSKKILKTDIVEILDTYASNKSETNNKNKA